MTIRELLAEESPTLRRRLASLFSGLPDETPASPLSCAAGEVVVRQDAPCRCVYVLVDGRADASGLQPGGPSHTYSEFGPLTLFGEYEALCGANCFLAEGYYTRPRDGTYTMSQIYAPRVDSTKQ